MKKIISFLMLMAVMTTAMAQLSTEKVYRLRISDARYTGVPLYATFMNTTTNSQIVGAVQLQPKIIASFANKNQLFRIEEIENSDSVYILCDNGFYLTQERWNPMASDETNATAFYVSNVTGSECYTIYQQRGQNLSNNQNATQNNNWKGYFGLKRTPAVNENLFTNQPKDESINWIFEEVTDDGSQYVYALKCTDADSIVGYLKLNDEVRNGSENKYNAATFSENPETYFFIKSSDNATLPYYFEQYQKEERYLGFGNTKPYNVSNIDKCNWVIEPTAVGENTYYIKKGASGNVYLGNASGVVGYATDSYIFTNQAQSNNVKWELVPYQPVEITSANAATLFSADALDIPAGVTAKYVKPTENEGSTGALKYTELTTGTIPANTAVVLIGEAGDYTFKVNTANVDVAPDNALFGYATETTVSDKTNIYALANKSQGVGFYPFAGTTYAAGKAYLNAVKLNPSNEARFFNIFNEDNETAIESIEGTEGAENAAIYDLSGRRVQSAQKGLYIMNGRIVIK